MVKFTIFVLGCLLLAYSCNGSMEEIVAELQRELQSLKTITANEIKELKNSAASYENKIEALEEEINALKVEKSNDSDFLKRRFVLGDNSLAEKPAFSASLKNHAANLGNFQTIQFDNVFTNDLGGYSGLTGVFTAPMNGTYFFTATVMSYIGEYLETELCLNGHALVYMYSRDSNYEQGTNSVVLVLKAGDKVWVRHHSSEGSNAYGNHWSSFSGFMI